MFYNVRVKTEINFVCCVQCRKISLERPFTRLGDVVENIVWTVIRSGAVSGKKKTTDISKKKLFVHFYSLFEKGRGGLIFIYKFVYFHIFI